ncbi:hypothetical protein AAF712_007906 [Marasmius tenuissimus]|uniref:Uncharacterized protein n=1 Tax=Marasmius tenuissimus TaxID=585030 RepID=A0ABR2ZTR1_9AGAR
MTSARPTPASEKSIYFDAPIANFHMQSEKQDLDQPILKPDGSDPVADLTREPTVAAATIPKPVPVNGNGVNGTHHDDVEVLESPINDEERITAHPNGSEGWLPAEDIPPKSATSPKDSSGKPVRSSSLLRKKRPASISSRASASATSLHRNKSTGAASTRSVSKRSQFTNVDGKPIDGSTFINGAGTTGPGSTAIADETLHKRHATADSSLNKKQKSKIEKIEGEFYLNALWGSTDAYMRVRTAKDGKKLSRIIKQEGRVEKQAMGVAIAELAELQKIQQAAVKREAKAHTQHTKSVTAFTKAEEAYLAARTKFETAQALMNAEQENLEIARNAAVEATTKMQEKSQEVEALRQTYGVDERERAVKIGELTRSTTKRRSWF